MKSLFTAVLLLATSSLFAQFEINESKTYGLYKYIISESFVDGVEQWGEWKDTEGYFEYNHNKKLITILSNDSKILYNIDKLEYDEVPLYIKSRNCFEQNFFYWGNESNTNSDVIIRVRYVTYEDIKKRRELNVTVFYDDKAISFLASYRIHYFK